eukprot:gene6975-9578_t
MENSENDYAVSQEMISQLQQRVIESHPELAKEQRSFLSSSTLSRYIIAREGNIDKAFDMIVASLNWRHEWHPEKISAHEVREDISMCKMYIQGHDKVGRPVVIFKPANDRDGVGSILTKVRFYVWVLERAIQSMPEDVSQMVWIVDLRGYRVGPSDLKRVKLARALLETLQNQYPERVAKLILVKPPWYFRVLLAVVKPFVSQRTLNKLETDNGDGSTFLVLHKLIDLSQLETTYGGLSPPHYGEIPVENNQIAMEHTLAASENENATFSPISQSGVTGDNSQGLVPDCSMDALTKDSTNPDGPFLSNTPRNLI